MARSPTPAIGIDLGTTFTRVAVFQNGKVEIISTDQGNTKTASCVAFTNVECLIGESARQQATTNPSNTIFSSKRWIGQGRKFDLPVEGSLKHYPVRSVSENGKPMWEVKYKNNFRKYYPEEILSMILAKVKNAAETSLGTAITDVVIGVPSHFTFMERQAVKDAGTMAGLNVIRVISESTLAVMGYALKEKKIFKSENKILVFDLGGGTLSVTVMTVKDNIFEVKSVAGVTLGGDDFNDRMVTHFVHEFRATFNKDLSIDQHAILRLRIACEHAKHYLTTCTKAAIEIDSLFEDIKFDTSITRTRFEELNADLFQKTIETVEKALRAAEMDKDHIHDVIVLGESARIPKIQTLLQTFFNGKSLNTMNNMYLESVAYGAAAQAAILKDSRSKEVKSWLLLDVNPYSIGIETDDGVMTPIIGRSVIPYKQTRTFTTCADEQPGILIQVYEGESLWTEDNHLLGMVQLVGIPLKPRGIPEIDITIDIDVNHVIYLHAIEKSSGKEIKFTVSNNPKTFSPTFAEHKITTHGGTTVRLR